MSEHDEAKCETCAGCGKVSDEPMPTPWKYWEALPVQSAVAIRLGWVKPVICPDCKGTGKRLIESENKKAPSVELEAKYDDKLTTVKQTNP